MRERSTANQTSAQTCGMINRWCSWMNFFGECREWIDNANASYACVCDLYDYRGIATKQWPMLWWLFVIPIQIAHFIYAHTRTHTKKNISLRNVTIIHKRWCGDTHWNDHLHMIKRFAKNCLHVNCIAKIKRKVWMFAMWKKKKRKQSETKHSEVKRKDFRCKQDKPPNSHCFWTIFSLSFARSLHLTRMHIWLSFKATIVVFGIQLLFSISSSSPLFRSKLILIYCWQ